MAKKTTLKTKTNEILYPQTLADVVYTSTNSDTTVNDVLSQYGDDIDALKATASKNKGWFANETALLTAYPNNISTPSDRAGWYAIVGETENDALFVWDVDDNKWVDVGAYQVDGIRSINTTVLPDANGNAVLTGSDINATIDGETETITTHLGEIYSVIDDINEDLTDLINKTTMLYLSGVELASAVGSTEEYPEGQLAVCTGDYSDYSEGTTYKYVSTTETVEEEEVTTYSWEEFTTAGGGIAELEGTKASPILLYNLEVGYYLLSGYFKFAQGSQYLGYVTNSENFSIGPTGKVLMCVGGIQGSSNTIIFIGADASQMVYSSNDNTLYNAVVVGSETISTWTMVYSNGGYSVQAYNTSLLKQYYGSDYNGVFATALKVDNTAAFEPTGDYNPATKKYVDDNVGAIRPIKNLANPLSLGKDEFATSTSTSDDSLYYGKKTGETSEYVSIQDSGKYYSLYLDKSIASASLSGSYVTVLEFNIDLGYRIQLQIVIDSGAVASIVEYFTNTTLYNTNDGWYDGSSTGYVNLFTFAESVIHASPIGYMEWSYGNDYSNTLPYFKSLETVPVVTATRLALYKDTIPTYTGEQNNPLVLYTLLSDKPEGFMFYLNGYFKENTNNSTICRAAVNSLCYISRFGTTSGGYCSITVLNSLYSTVSSTPTLSKDKQTMSFIDIKNTHTGAPSGYYISFNEIVSRLGSLNNNGAYVALTTTNTNPFTPTADYHPATKKYVDDSIVTTQSEIAQFFEDNPSFKYNGSPIYLQDIAGKALTDADVQAYLTALTTKYGTFTNNSVNLIPYTSNRWAVLQTSNMSTYTLWYELPDQCAIYHLAPNTSYVFEETFDNLLDSAGGGSTLYRHNVSMTSSNPANYVFFELINNDSSQLNTLVKVENALYDAGYTGSGWSTNNVLLCRGHGRVGQNYAKYLITGISCTTRGSSLTLITSCFTFDGTQYIWEEGQNSQSANYFVNATITDTVTAL